MLPFELVQGVENGTFLMNNLTIKLKIKNL